MSRLSGTKIKLYNFIAPALAALIVSGTSGFAAKKNQKEPPLKVSALAYNHPGGISYTPNKPIVVDIGFINKTGESIDLKNASWKVTHSRERMAGARNFKDSRYEEVKTIADGKTENLPATLHPGKEAKLNVEFTPNQYGYFFIKLDPEGDNKDWLRLCGSAVVRPPEPGFKPHSYYQAGNINKNPASNALILSRYGIKKIRNSQRTAPKRKGNEYDWTDYDEIMESLRTNKILSQVALLPVNFFEEPKIGAYWNGRKYNAVAKWEDLEDTERFGTYAHYIKKLLTRYPDTIHMAQIRNEPWEAGSISNWHVTAEYMRKALEIARKIIDETGADVELVGTDSIDNTVDQVAIAGAHKLLDAVTHHPYSLKFRDTMATAQAADWGLPVYDNESWLAPEDMSIIASNTMNLASGYRLMHSVKEASTMPALGNDIDEILTPRPIGQAIGTWLHFVEDTEHTEELNPDFLPHIHLFKGREGYEDKHAAILFGRVKLYGHRSHDETVGDEVFPQVKGDGQITIPNPDNNLHVFDFLGNEVQKNRKTISLPLNENPYYLTSSKGLAALKVKLKNSAVSYDDPGVELAMMDLTRPFEQQPEIRVRISNCIKKDQTVKLSLQTPKGWEIEPKSQILNLSPGQMETSIFTVKKAKTNSLNSYELTAVAETPDGTRKLTEDLHVSVFEKGTPFIDGDLSDWAQLGAVPTYMSGKPLEVDWQQKMWFPTLKAESRDENNVWARFAGMWDDDYFYIAAEVHDPTENYIRPAGEGDLSIMHDKPFDYLYWSFAIPGFMKRGDKERRLDGVKIAFNVFPVGEKEDPLFSKEAQKKMNTRFHRIGPDYEYDMYLAQSMKLVDSYQTVKEHHLKLLEEGKGKYSGSKPPFEEPQLVPSGEPKAEMWCRVAPGIPRHRYYPVSPRWKNDQHLVKSARLIIKREGNNVRYEAAIPWSELEKVNPETGKEVKFSYFVWDRNKLALDWVKDRSIGANLHQKLIPFKRTNSIETPWRFINAVKENEIKSASAE